MILWFSGVQSWVAVASWLLVVAAVRCLVVIWSCFYLVRTCCCSTLRVWKKWYILLESTVTWFEPTVAVLYKWKMSFLSCWVLKLLRILVLAGASPNDGLLEREFCWTAVRVIAAVSRLLGWSIRVALLRPNVCLPTQWNLMPVSTTNEAALINGQVLPVLIWHCM